MKPAVQILNGTLHPLTLDETVGEVLRAIAEARRGWLCTVNVSMLMAMRISPRLQSFVDRAMLSVADGQPLVWCAPIFGAALPERVAGIDLMESLFAGAASAGHTVYLLGAEERVLERALQSIRKRHPDLQLHGAHGHFPAQEAPHRAAAIRASGASLLFVGMGMPRQENFIEDHWNELGVAVAVPVGGSFDVVGGLVMRAPRWVRCAGLEWLFRLCQEPRRLFVRYLATNTQFCLLVGGAAWLRLKRWVARP